MNIKYEVDNSDLLKINLNDSSIITIILNNDINNIEYNFNNGDYKVLVFVKNLNDTTINEKGKITNSSVVINYLDLNNHNLNSYTNIDVLNNSSLNIFSTYLGTDCKHVEFNLNNLERESHINIENNVVCLNDSIFNLNVVGNIYKGAKSSTCHQRSRCLTVDNPKQAKILPVLNIDENDVEASHSLSSGTIDKDVLFYINSRGLTKKEALLLMVVSYLLPNENIFDDYLCGKEIFKEAERRVSDLCLM